MRINFIEIDPLWIYIYFALYQAIANSYTSPYRLMQLHALGSSRTKDARELFLL